MLLCPPRRSDAVAGGWPGAWTCAWTYDADGRAWPDAIAAAAGSTQAWDSSPNETRNPSHRGVLARV